MRDRAFFDSNVVLYAFVRNDPRHAEARRLLEAGGHISVQVLNEFANVARRKMGMAWEAVRDGLLEVRELFPEPLPITTRLHEQGLDVAQRYRLSVYDGLIVAAALNCGCAILWSEDLQDGQVFDNRLTVRNPFLGH